MPIFTTLKLPSSEASSSESIAASTSPNCASCDCLFLRLAAGEHFASLKVALKNSAKFISSENSFGAAATAALLDLDRRNRGGLDQRSMRSRLRATFPYSLGHY